MVKSLCREEANLKEFESKTSEMYDASYRAARLSGLFFPAIQIIGSLALGAVIWFGGVQQLNGTMTIGDIQAFISCIFFMMQPILELARMWASLQSSMTSAERIFSF